MAKTNPNKKRNKKRSNDRYKQKPLNQDTKNTEEAKQGQVDGGVLSWIIWLVTCQWIHRFRRTGSNDVPTDISSTGERKDFSSIHQEQIPDKAVTSTSEDTSNESDNVTVQAKDNGRLNAPQMKKLTTDTKTQLNLEQGLSAQIGMVQEIAAKDRGKRKKLQVKSNEEKQNTAPLDRQLKDQDQQQTPDKSVTSSTEETSNESDNVRVQAKGNTRLNALQKKIEGLEADKKKHLQTEQELLAKICTIQETAAKDKEELENLNVKLNEEKQKTAALDRQLKDQEKKERVLDDINVKNANLENINTNFKREIDSLQREKKRMENEHEQRIQMCNQHLNSKDKLINNLKDEKQKLDDEKQDALRRLSAMMSVKLRDNNPNIADLSDQFRPTKLCEQFSELSDNEWTEAFDALQDKFEERRAISFLLDIVMESYQFCDQELRAVWRFAESWFIEENAATAQQTSKTLKDGRKQKVIGRVSDIAQKYKVYLLELYNNENLTVLVKSDALNNYIAACVKLSLLMTANDPPVVIECPGWQPCLERPCPEESFPQEAIDATTDNDKQRVGDEIIKLNESTLGYDERRKEIRIDYSNTFTQDETTNTPDDTTHAQNQKEITNTPDDTTHDQNQKQITNTPDDTTHDQNHANKERVGDEITKLNESTIGNDEIRTAIDKNDSDPNTHEEITYTQDDTTHDQNHFVDTNSDLARFADAFTHQTAFPSAKPDHKPTIQQDDEMHANDDKQFSEKFNVHAAIMNEPTPALSGNTEDIHTCYSDSSKNKALEESNTNLDDVTNNTHTATDIDRKTNDIASADEMPTKQTELPSAETEFNANSNAKEGQQTDSSENQDDTNINRSFGKEPTSCTRPSEDDISTQELVNKLSALSISDNGDKKEIRQGSDQNEIDDAAYRMVDDASICPAHCTDDKCESITNNSDASNCDRLNVEVENVPTDDNDTVDPKVLIPVTNTMSIENTNDETGIDPRETPFDKNIIQPTGSEGEDILYERTSNSKTNPNRNVENKPPVNTTEKEDTASQLKAVSNSVPSMHVFKERHIFDKDKFKEYTSRGQFVEYFVWPIIYLHRDGPMLGKGIAQGSKEKMEDRSSRPFVWWKHPMRPKEWQAAFKSLQSSHLEEKHIISFLLDVVMESYQFCAHQLHADYGKFTEYLQELCADQQLQELMKSKSAVMDYISSCIKLTLVLTASNPPMVIECPGWKPCLERSDASLERTATVEKPCFESDKYNAYRETGSFVDYFVWPITYSQRDGKILARGIAQGTNQTSNDDYLNVWWKRLSTARN